MNEKLPEMVVSTIEEAPSNYYIRTATDEYLFIKTKSRERAQAAINAIYGHNFYVVRSCDLGSKRGKEVTAR